MNWQNTGINNENKDEHHENKDYKDDQQEEILYKDELFVIKHEWINCRPIPEEEAWFENIWNAFLRDEIVK